MSKPEIKITARRQNIYKLEENKKPIHSNFLVTLNLNQQYHKDEHKQNIENDMEIFDQLINGMLQNIDQYISDYLKVLNIMMIQWKMYQQIIQLK